MIYIYGDSHGGHSFKLLQLPHENHSQPSITMFRIGRDNKIIKTKGERCYRFGLR